MTGVLQVLMGASAASGTTVDFTNQSLEAWTQTAGTGQTAQSGYVIRTTGAVDWEYIIDATGGSALLETAISPSTAVANYEVRATLASGTTPSGPTLGSWHALTADRNWYISQIGAIGVLSCILNFQVRLIGTGTDLDTWTVELIARVTA